jgi:hypothetical protein
MSKIMCKNGTIFRLNKWTKLKVIGRSEKEIAMLSVNHFLSQTFHLSEFTFGQRIGQTQALHPPDQKTASQSLHQPRGGETAPTGDAGELKTDREAAGASLSQLIDALSAAIVRDTYINGDRILMALAEAAVLERELSNSVPRRWRIQQALNALLKMGPHVTAALAAVLEHPAARSHIARMFSG